MSSNLHITRALTKNVRMSIPKRTVSKAEMNEEWQQILAARRDPAQFRPLYEKHFEGIFRFVIRVRHIKTP